MDILKCGTEYFKLPAALFPFLLGSYLGKQELYCSVSIKHSYAEQSPIQLYRWIFLSAERIFCHSLALFIGYLCLDYAISLFQSECIRNER